MSNDKQLKFGVVLSYVQVALAAMLTLFYTPVMINRLGTSEYGLYNTVSSTISMMSVLSLGFGSGYIRYYSMYNSENDNESIYRLNSLFLKIFALIGAVALFCGLYLSVNLRLVFDEGLSENEYIIARRLFVLLTFNLAISFPMSVFSTIISVHEKFIVLKTLGIIKNICGPLLTLPVLLMGYKSVAMVVVTVSVNLFVDVIYVYYVIIVMKQKFAPGRVDIGLIKDILKFTIFIALNILVDQINTNIDKVLLGRFKGTSEVSVYSVGFTLSSAYTTISTSISSVFSPRIYGIVNMYEGERRNKRLTELFVNVGRIQYMVIVAAALYLLIFGREFINLWVGEKYATSYFVALILILPGTIPLIQNVGINIQRALNKHRFRGVVYTIMATINLALSIVLCQMYGAVGSTIGTAIAVLTANGLIMNIYYSRECGIDIKLFWINIIKVSKGLIFPMIVGYFIHKIVIIDNYSKLLITGIIYIISYIISLYIFSMNKRERGLLTSLLIRSAR